MSDKEHCGNCGHESFYILVDGDEKSIFCVNCDALYQEYTDLELIW